MVDLSARELSRDAVATMVLGAAVNGRRSREEYEASP